MQNVNTPVGTDRISIHRCKMLEDELPQLRGRCRWWSAGSVTDLRCGRAPIMPKVEQVGSSMPRTCLGGCRVGPGRGRTLVPLEDGRPVYGGTPADASVIEAIRRMKGDGLRGDVLSVHPDGANGGQWAARSLYGLGRTARAAVARPHHAVRGPGAHRLARMARPRRARRGRDAFSVPRTAADFRCLGDGVDL